MVTALLVVTAGCSGLQGTEGDKGYVEFDGSIVVFDEDERELVEFPDEVQTIEGQSLNLDQEGDGRVVVLNVWASWCGPCIQEAPALRSVSQNFENKDVLFVGVNIRDTDSNARAFTRHHGLTYPNISDASGELLLEFGPGYSGALPSTMIIGKDGRVEAAVFGEASAGTLRALINDGLDGDAPSGNVDTGTQDGTAARTGDRFGHAA